jgi:hypothetical protein
MFVLFGKSDLTARNGHNVGDFASHGHVSGRFSGAAVKKAPQLAAFDETR